MIFHNAKKNFIHYHKYSETFPAGAGGIFWLQAKNELGPSDYYYISK